jgi:hypothetical protein
MPDDYDQLIADRQRGGRQLLSKMPNCPIRRAVAEICMDLTWRFVAMHELIHIVHGHVEYLQSLSPHIPFFAEVLRAHGSVAVTTSDMDRQTMELWADYFAISVVMGGLLTKSPGRINNVPLNPRERLFLWVYTLFRLWGLSVDPSDMRGSHPPTAIRFMMALRFPCCIVLNEAAKDIPEEEFFDIARRSLREADQAIRYCGGTDLPVADLLAIGDPKVQLHINSLVDHFDDVLKPKLMKHSYIPLTTGPYH